MHDSWKDDASTNTRLQTFIRPGCLRARAGALQLLSATKHLASRHRTPIISSPAVFLPQVSPTDLLQLDTDSSQRRQTHPPPCRNLLSHIIFIQSGTGRSRNGAFGAQSCILRSLEGVPSPSEGWELSMHHRDRLSLAFSR